MPKLWLNKPLLKKRYREGNRYTLTNKYRKQHVTKDNFCMFLHCTSIVAVFVALPHSLLASYLYSPAWVLLMCVTSNMCPLWRWPPGLIQDTIGAGTPDTWHDRVTLLPSVIFWSCVIWVIEEGTVKEKWKCERILKVASNQLVHFNTCIISFPTYSACNSFRLNCHRQTSWYLKSCVYTLDG